MTIGFRERNLQTRSFFEAKVITKDVPKQGLGSSNLDGEFDC